MDAELPKASLGHGETVAPIPAFLLDDKEMGLELKGDQTKLKETEERLAPYEEQFR